MKLAIIGTGYVGLVTGTCLAEAGHVVTCVDIDKKKIDELKKGHIPIYEPGLEKLVKRNIKNKRLFFTPLLKKAISDSEVIFVAVGTPPKRDGKANLKYVFEVASEIGKNLKGYQVISIKSTVPVGTCQKVKEIIKKYYKGDFDVTSCPEFLREGSAVTDFFNPDRIVIGSDNKKASRIMKKVFIPIKGKKLITPVESSEMIKYASNAFLATKISFINEIANVCEEAGANIDDVAQGMGLDRRIGPNFLKAGLGYGGSCFPKDVEALDQIAGYHGYNFKLLKSVIQVNNDQRKKLVEKIKKNLPGLKGKIIAVYGLAFKDNTDDVRESASIDIIKRLQKLGLKINAYDPIAESNARKILRGVAYFDDPYRACQEAEAVVIATEWPEFKKYNWQKIKKLIKNPIVFDGRNLLDHHKIEKLGFQYFGVGRS